MIRDLGSDISIVQNALRHDGDPKALRAYRNILEALRETHMGVGEFLPELDRDIDAAVKNHQQPVNRSDTKDIW